MLDMLKAVMDTCGCWRCATGQEFQAPEVPTVPTCAASEMPTALPAILDIPRPSAAPTAARADFNDHEVDGYLREMQAAIASFSDSGYNVQV